MGRGAHSYCVFRMWRSCPLGLGFPPHFSHIVVEVRTSGPPHVLLLWWGVSKRMLPVVGGKQEDAPCGGG